MPAPSRSHPRNRVSERSRRTYTRAVKPNPPYMATVVVAIVLMVIGLSLDGTFFTIAPLNDIVASLLKTVGIAVGEGFAHLLIVVGPTLLIVGSLVRGL